MDKLKAREIILKNLSEASDALSRKSLIYDAQIKELAYLLVNEALEEPFDGFEQLANRLRDLLSSFFSEEENDTSEGARRALRDVDFKIRFCALVADELSRRNVKAPEVEPFDEVFYGEINIACFSNRSSDEAYKIFAKALPRASQVICESIVALCEEVADGRCELCLLPIYSSSDGLMQNIYRHTLRYGLSPVMSVDLPSDGDIFVRYLLFAATPCKRERACSMTLTVVSQQAEKIAFLPSALGAYGATLEDMTSLGSSLYEGSPAFQFVFSVKDADLMKIHLFLQINFPRFEINGIYEKIPTE